jgi:hypothetical protein
MQAVLRAPRETRGRSLEASAAVLARLGQRPAPKQRAGPRRLGRSAAAASTLTATMARLASAGLRVRRMPAVEGAARNVSGLPGTSSSRLAASCVASPALVVGRRREGRRLAGLGIAAAAAGAGQAGGRGAPGQHVGSDWVGWGGGVGAPLDGEGPAGGATGSSRTCEGGAGRRPSPAPSAPDTSSSALMACASSHTLTGS